MPTRSKGVTAFLVYKSDGLTFGQPMRKMGQRAIVNTELFLDDVFVPDDQRLGAEGQGFYGLMRTFDISRTTLAASALTAIPLEQFAALGLGDVVADDHNIDAAGRKQRLRLPGLARLAHIVPAPVEMIGEIARHRLGDGHKRDDGSCGHFLHPRHRQLEMSAGHHVYTQSTFH